MIDAAGLPIFVLNPLICRRRAQGCVARWSGGRSLCLVRRKCFSPQAHHGDDDDDDGQVTFEEGGLKTSFDFFKIPGKTSDSLLRLKGGQ